MKYLFGITFIFSTGIVFRNTHRHLIGFIFVKLWDYVNASQFPTSTAKV